MREIRKREGFHGGELLTFDLLNHYRSLSTSLLTENEMGIVHDRVEKLLAKVVLTVGMFVLSGLFASGEVTSTAELVRAVNGGAAGETIRLASETFTLDAPLRPKKNMTIRGNGADQTILRADSSWTPGTDSLPDDATDHTSVNQNAYLIDLGNKTTGVTLSHLTLTGPSLHGAVYGNNCDGLTLAHLRVEDFQWSGVRTFRMDNASVHDNTFVNAGGKHKHAGGALYLTWFKTSRIWNNHIRKTKDHHSNFFGIKGRQARNCRIDHNTIEVNFSIELPFQHDRHVEIDHNVLHGVISIPKHGGGALPDNGRTFHIHHNWLTTSYALEWPRNGAEVDHNLFTFDTRKDKGNLISNFAGKKAPGPTRFHHNYVRNPGRGLYWGRGVYNNFHFYNNHVIGRTTKTPRTQGLFGFNKKTDFSSVVIKNNIIRLKGRSRPLMRNSASYGARIKNNQLDNISDSDRYDNPQTNATQGLEKPLRFQAGVKGRYTISGWNVTHPDSSRRREGEK